MFSPVSPSYLASHDARATPALSSCHPQVSSVDNLFLFDFKYAVTGKACAVRPLERHDGVKVTIIIRNIYLRRWLESDSKRLYYLGGKELHDI